MKARDQERAFAAENNVMPDFARRLLAGTKFTAAAVVLDLSGCDNHRIGHQLGKQSGTDILIVFEYETKRFV